MEQYIEYHYWSWTLVLIIFLLPPFSTLEGIIGVKAVGKETGKLIPGTYHRHPRDGRTQTNLYQFFENIPHGPQYRATVLSIKLMKIVGKPSQGWEVTITRNTGNSSMPSLANQAISLRSGLQMNDPFLGSGILVNTTATIGDNRVVLERDMKGVNVYEVMAFSKLGCRTTYYTSDEYGIDFLRRKKVARS